MNKISPGMKFGYLEIIEVRENGKKRQSWLCKCDCGKVLTISRNHILGTKHRRPNRSCGCSENSYGGLTMKHTRINQIWHNMIKRCYNTNADNYDRYGGKGVTVSDEWRNDFITFLDWSLANGYDDNLTIDRIDNNLPYSADNCRWVDYYEQNQNKGVDSRNQTGHTGVCKYPLGYRAYIQRDGKRKNLGKFRTLDEAIKARKEAEESYRLYKKI